MCIRDRAYALAREWSTRSRQSYWLHDCDCDYCGKEWRDMLMRAVGILQKHKKLEQEKQRRKEIHDALMDVENASIKLAEAERKKRADRSRLERDLRAHESVFSDKIENAPQARPVVENRMSDVISKVHTSTTQKELRRVSFCNRQIQQSKEAAESRAAKSKEEEKKKLINKQTVPPVPDKPKLADFVMKSSLA